MPWMPSAPNSNAGWLADPVEGRPQPEGQSRPDGPDRLAGGAVAERAIRDQFKALEAFPAAGRAIGFEDRKWPIPFGRDGFVAIYRIEADRIVIGRIFHCRQDR